MKKNLSVLFENLDWNKPHKIQQIARNELKNEKDLSIFFQPVDKNTGKKVWENCARILIEKTDEELLPYINKLFEWLQDRNWPGEYIIRYRLQKFPLSKIKNMYEESLKIARQNKDDIWYNNLNDLHFKKNRRNQERKKIKSS